MAKRFGGFTPEQMGKIIPEMQGMQADEQTKFLASQPGAAARVGRMAELAQQRIGMAVGGYVPQQQQQPQAMAQLDYNRLYQQPNPTQGQPIEVKSLQPNAFATGGTATLATQPVKTAAGTTYKNTYTGGVGAKPSHSTDNDKPGNPPPNTPNTTGGFDDVQTATTVQPTITQSINSSTPIEGLPEIPVDPITEEKLEEYTSGIPSWANKVKDLFSSGEIPEDTTDWKVTGGKRNYTLEFKDGTKIPLTGLNRYDTEQPVIQGIVDNLEKIKAERSVYNEQKSIYEKQLDVYRQNQYTQAGTALTDVRASLDTAQTAVSQEQGALNSLSQQLSNLPADDPQREVMQKLVDDQQIKVTQAKANLAQASANVARIGTPSTTELQAAALSDPMSMVTKADVVTVSDAQKAEGMIAEGTGQAPAEAAKATQTEANIAADVPLAEEFEAAGMTPKEAAAEVANVMSKLTAVTGKPSAEALADAATMSTSELAQLGLTAEQLSRAQRVEGVAPLEVTPEMEVTSAVDFERAKAETNFAAATGVPSTEATVQGQLTGLLEQFEGGDTPAWAAGAMRAATSALATRGLGASSMAGQAIVQAAMESALPIAMADAQTRASFEAQNLSNRQQAAVFAAEQRAKFLGMEFDQEFQSRVQNAARIADVAKINFTAEQQVALENARMAQTVDIANLDARNAKVMADAAAMSQLDMANLNNRQQANVQRAQAFLDFDMTSMSNQQQVAMFKAQSLASVYTSDTAAVNAAKQFNAASDDQVGMFFSNLQNNINQFNNEQYNAMEKFNAGEANALSQFNAVQQNTRDQFNAQNQLVVAQANAQWSQAITTMDNAALNQANRDAALAANNFTTTGYNNAIQRERDTLAWAWQSAENTGDRDAKIAVAKINEGAEDDSGSALSAAAGTFMGAIASNAADIIFS
mgnify:CR=1 FL=1